MRLQRVWPDLCLPSLLAIAGLWGAASSAPAADVTLVATDAACRYQVPSSGSDGTNWTAVAFDDSAWDQGTSGIGYDKDGTYASLFGTTVTNGTTDVYVRFAFTVPAGAIYDSLTLRLKYEDGFIAYLNGAEVARSNALSSSVYNSVATASRSDSLAMVFMDYSLTPFLPKLQAGANVLAIHLMNNDSSSTDLLLQPQLNATTMVFSNIAINEFEAVNDSTKRNSLGKFGDWVELYNPYTTNVSLTGWYLTDNASKKTKWQFPNVTNSSIAAKGYLIVWADDLSVSLTNKELHASFSLSGGGEYLGLVMPDGVTVVSEYAPTFPEQFSDISYGIGAGGERRYFATPTPGAVNAFAGGSNQVEGVKFSPKRGVYVDAMPQVTVTAGASGSAVYYTTDFTAPSSNSTLYSSPLDLSHTAVFRAVAYKSGFAPSEVDTHSYVSADDVLRQPVLPAGFPTNMWITAAVNGTNAPDYAMNPAVVAAYGADLTNALKALPSLSLVTTVSNLFDAATGIYTHPQSLGTNWERATSAEWIDPDNSSRFQIGCGLQIQGGAFRGFQLSLKKSFSLQFRGVYGESRLGETLFDGQTMDALDDLVLRAGANDAWNKWGHQKTQYIADEFIRRSFLAMGQWAPHGRFVHVYLDGLYWGIYNVTEKVSSEMAAAHYGGSDSTWDVRSQDAALDGDYTIWNAMVKLLQTNVMDNALYQRVQGNNPDGSRNFGYPIYLDVQNYIDYLVINYWSANTDWPNNNWRAFRDRNQSISTGYKCAIWDCEASLGVWGDLTTDRTGPIGQNGVATMHSNLLFNAEYRLRFADRIQKHLFNGGELTAEKTAPRYQELANLIEPALVAESARWGDQDGNATHTVEQWRTQRDYVLNTFLPQRGAYALQYFRNRGLYPTNAAPSFSPFGGLFTNGVALTMSAAAPIFFTTDGSDPRQYGTGAILGTLYTNGVALTRATRVKARARSASTGEWSALTEAVFTPEEKPALRVTELMYHPRTRDAAEGLDGDDEYIELQNIGSTPVGLAGLKFTQGVIFDFANSPIQSLAPNQFLLVVKSVAAFTNRYPSVSAALIAGVFAYPAQSLDDAGEKVELEDALGRKVASFTYNNTWRPEADGAGHSLVPAPGAAQADGELDYPGNWLSSVYIGGSPGQAEPAPLAEALVLNEIVAHTDYASPPYDSNDGIELYNTAGLPVVFGAGWYLSDDADDLAKWPIPATNTVAAGGWIYFDEIHNFHTPLTNGFGLNKGGDQVFLSHLPADGQGRVVDAVRFEGEENGVSLIRYPDGAPYWVHGVPTPAAANQLAENDVLISEVMFHPAPTAANPENNENDEYVEICNPKTVPVALKDLVENAGVWRLSGGIDYAFPDGTVLPAGGRLAVVSFDPSSTSASLDAFLAAYGLTNGQVHLVGPYSGHLNNKSATVRLERPVQPDVSGDPVSWHVVDQVTYYDAGAWPAEADGTGLPLVRLPGQSSGDDAANWVVGLAASPGQGAAKVVVTAPEANTGYLAPASVPVSAAVDLSFVAGAVRRVVFAVDGVDAAVVSNAPYAASVTLDAHEGVRQITARLTDDEGETTSRGVPVVCYTNMPDFSAGCDQLINLKVTDEIGLHAAVGDSGGTTNPVHFFWSCPGNSAVVFENPTQANASARFSQAGQYELMLTLCYGQLVTNRFITVTVSDANTTNSIPYKESFESYELGVTMIGVEGWYGGSGDGAVVETNRFRAGAGGSPLAGPHEKGLSFSEHVTNLFDCAGARTNVCFELLIGCEAMAEDCAAAPSDVQLGFYVNTSWHLMVWHGQSGGTNRWTELPEVSVRSNAFVRLTVMAESGREAAGVLSFRIWADRVAVTNPATRFLSAVTNGTALSSIEFAGEGQVDDLVIDTYNSMLYRRITASAGSHGRVVPAGEMYVPVGTSTNISVLPDPFYRVSAVLADGEGVGAVESYAFTNVWDEHTLAADFAAKLTASGVPELWLNGLNPLWSENFEQHAREDADGDGFSNESEFAAGTDATNALSAFLLKLDMSNGMSVLSFPTVPFNGEAYGLNGSRRYAVEQADNLTSGAWSGISGLTNVVGGGQTVIYTNAVESVDRRFFRGRVWLAP